MILAADVGGTNTHLALYSPGSAPRQPEREHRAASREHASLEAIVREFLEPVGARPTRAVFGIAGAVVENRVATTNLPWVTDGASLGAAMGGARVTLINDLEATAWGLDVLGATDLEMLQRGQTEDGNRALIAAGTGLGEAIVVRDGDRWLPTASEGGHADFGPRDALEDDLNRWLRAKYQRVSCERVLSGPGLADLYRFMSDTGRGAEPREMAVRFAAATDPAAVVTEAALDGSCERARMALEKFVEVYGAEAGNLALTALAIGGVFVGGGIAPRMLEIFRAGHFVRGFTTKGRLSPVLARIPVWVVLDPQTALWGAAAYGLSSR